MKTLKKVLCLVLALVMVVGTMAISAAAFEDDDEITNKDAAAVLNGIKVITGYENGEFDPDGKLTRDQGAAIITRLLQAGDLKLSTKFADVKGLWSESVVAYCENEGIVAGYGDGLYHPADSLTAVQFAKMVLVALGYDAKIEGLEGETFYNNTVKLATKLGINVKAAAWDQPITRENAAQMAFNALSVEKVTYTGGSTIEINGATISSGATKEGTRKTLAQGFGLNLTKVETLDAMGRIVAYYNVTDSDPIYVDVAPVVSFNGQKTESALFNELGVSGTSVTAAYYSNGVALTDLTIEKADTTNKVGRLGDVTEVYKYTVGANKGKYVVVSNSEFLAQVTKVTAAKAATATAPAVKATATIKNLWNNATAVVETADLSKDEYLVATWSLAENGTIDKYYAVKTASGVKTAYTASSVTFDGTKHNLSAIYATGSYANPAASDINWTSAYTYYLASDGTTIIAAKAPAGSTAVNTDYVYVVNYQGKNITASSDLYTSVEAAQSVKASVIYTDGTAAVVDLKVTKDSSDSKYKFAKPAADATVGTAEVGNDAIAVAVGTWFTYETNTDGTYTLGQVNAAYAKIAEGVTLTAKKSDTFTFDSGDVTSKVTNSATKVMTRDNDGVVTVTTGLVSKETSLTGKVLITANGPKATTVSAIYAVGSSRPTDAATVTYAYAVASGSSVKKGTEWTFYINGAAETKIIADGQEVAAGTVYTLTEDVTNGNFTVRAVANQSVTGVVTVADTSFFRINGTDYYYASNAVVFDATTAVAGKAATVAEGDTVKVVGTSSSVLAVYITAHAE